MMTVTKSQKRLFIILAIVVVYAAIDFMMNREDYEQTYAKSPTVDHKSTLIVKARTTNTQPDLSWGRDPFSRGVTKTKIRRQKPTPQVRLVLNAITYSKENSIAIINDEILQQGDMIEGYVVEQISADEVVLKNNGKTVRLKSR
jgi:type II secretory pathway component PulC